ncbi:MAG TPA: gluconokinase, partial [Ktedonobacteraceae bacterium]|nr:gluconokinase [Ktedonobacteraceae bacterium]
IIGLDIGTTDCKAIALDERWQVMASFQEKYELRVPRPGWAEQDSEEVWRAVAKALADLSSRLPTSEVLGIGLSGAMHSLIMLDEHEKPLAPAMTWADQRAADIAQALRQRTDPIKYYQRTGCPLQAIYHPAKARWCVDVSGQKFARLVSIKEFILYRLTGIWAIDLGLASTTGLLDMHRRRWDAEALSLAGVAVSQLSPLVSSQAVVGSITPEAAHLTGLRAGLPVVAGGSDGGMAMVGVQEHTVITVGTSGAVRRVDATPMLDPQARTWCYIQDDAQDKIQRDTQGNANNGERAGRCWLIGGAINNGGLAAQWAKEKFYPHEEFETMFQEVSKIEAGSAGVMCLPYLAGERTPLWDADLRATLSGFGLEHSRAHLARAVLEGVGYCLADVWEIIDSGSGDTSVKLTGGITHSPVWSQIVCDILGVPLRIARGADASATGAALTAGEALGKPISLPQEEPTTLAPDPSRHATYQKLHRAFQERRRKQ